MPPSPLLFARMMKLTYFRLTTIISDQKNSERMPRTLSGVIGTGWWAPPKTSFSAYSGLVPMSPKTTPIAPTNNKPVRLFLTICHQYSTYTYLISWYNMA